MIRLFAWNAFVAVLMIVPAYLSMHYGGRGVSTVELDVWLLCALAFRCGGGVICARMLTTKGAFWLAVSPLVLLEFGGNLALTSSDFGMRGVDQFGMEMPGVFLLVAAVAMLLGIRLAVSPPSARPRMRKLGVVLAWTSVVPTLFIAAFATAMSQP